MVNETLTSEELVATLTAIGHPLRLRVIVTCSERRFDSSCYGSNKTR